MIFSTSLDRHSIYHFFGCVGFAILLFSVFRISLVFSGSFAFALGVLWEGLDEVNSRFKWQVKFLDPRGADILDLVMDWLGAFVGMLLCTLIR